MSDTTYNGWTNYATWRVNLEMLDGLHAYDDMAADDETDAYSFGEVLKEYAENTIYETSEAGLAREMLVDMQRIVDQLKEAERQSLHYLEGVNNTLRAAFENFGTQLTEQVRKAVGETDRQLGGGVQQLTGVVQELGSALARLKRA